MIEAGARRRCAFAGMRVMRAVALIMVGIAGVLLLAPSSGSAQQGPAAGTESKKKQPPPQQAKKQKSEADKSAPAPAGPKSAGSGMPDAKQMALLIQTFMVALGQANLTNNFTVLHALGAPSFRKENPPQKLSQTFSGFRTKGIDLLPIILYSPTLVQPPEFVSSDVLRVTGYYGTSPQQIHFDILLQPVEGAWRLFGISVSTRPAPAEAAQLK